MTTDRYAAIHRRKLWFTCGFSRPEWGFDIRAHESLSRLMRAGRARIFKVSK